jgi:serine/threonine protein kinase
MLEGKAHDVSLDIWCCGVLLFEMLTGVPPFTPFNSRDAKEKQTVMEKNITKLKYNMPDYISVLSNPKPAS